MHPSREVRPRSGDRDAPTKVRFSTASKAALGIHRDLRTAKSPIHDLLNRLEPFLSRGTFNKGSPPNISIGRVEISFEIDVMSGDLVPITKIPRVVPRSEPLDASAEITHLGPLNVVRQPLCTPPIHEGPVGHDVQRSSVEL